MAPAYIPGLQLAPEFYADVVGPLLEEHFPRLPCAAALLGPGSEVAGFDSQRSTDHDWGPRLQVFLPGSGPVPADDLGPCRPGPTPAEPLRGGASVEIAQRKGPEGDLEPGSGRRERTGERRTHGNPGTAEEGGEPRRANGKPEESPPRGDPEDVR